MKKLMFGAALAATSMAFAADPTEAQVYDVSMTINTTTEKFASNVKKSANPFVVDADTPEDINYRAQATRTWKGLIWGCKCDTILGTWEVIGTVKDAKGTVIAKTVGGCCLWDTKAKEVAYMGGYNVNAGVATVTLPTLDGIDGAAWGWDFLQNIDKKADKVEGVWVISTLVDTECNQGQAFKFVGAGFGTEKWILDADKDPTCYSYISTMSGEFAGWMMPVLTMGDNDTYGCLFCGGGEIAGVCGTLSDVWNCPCLNTDDATRTAAYGKWTIKYNASLSKKLQGNTSILNVYNFKSLPNVAALIAEAEEIVRGTVISYAKAKANLAAAEKALTTALENQTTAAADLLAAKADLDEVTRTVAYVKLCADHNSSTDEVEAAALVKFTEVTGSSEVNSAANKAKYGYYKQQGVGPQARWVWTDGTEPAASQTTADDAQKAYDDAKTAVSTAETAVTTAEKALAKAKQACEDQGEICE